MSGTYDFDGPPTGGRVARRRGEAAGGRAETRRQRRQRRRRLLLVVAVLAVVSLLGLTVHLLQSGKEAPAAPAVPARTQSTLLLQVKAASGSALSSSLVAHDPRGGDDRDDASGAVVLLPPQLLVNVPGSGSMRLDRALLTITPENTRNAISDLLGVTVDASWVIDLAGLARLVDGVGGVDVDVDVPVLGGPSRRVILLNPGEQRLNGTQAATFLGYLAEGEEEQARLARVQEVLSGVIGGLPASSAEVGQLLSGLGEGSVASIAVPALADFLAGVASDQRDDALSYENLPVLKIDSGGRDVTYRVDAAAARELVDRLLAQSVPPGAREGDNRVLVLNGVGTPNIGEKVRAKLVPAGLVFVGSRNAPNFDYRNTVVLVPEATPEAQALGERVATALGVPTSAVATAPIGSVADVIVVVGADFRP